MIIVMRDRASLKEISKVLKEIKNLGFRAHPIKGGEKTIIGIIGNGRTVPPEYFEAFPGVEKVVRILKPFKLASKEFKKEKSLIKINGISIGGKEIIVMAGPCSVESRSQILETAHAVKEAGAKILRGGAFKPRTSPYSFQGLKEKGLELLYEAKQETGLAIITEVMAPEHVKIVGEVADILQIGTRNMQNYALLEAVGKYDKPVLLKRGMMSTVEELLMAAEYILSNGNYRVILCERGIRTFEKYTRNTLDLTAVPLINQLSHLPVCIDPSHGTGKRNLVIPASKAAVAIGADALLVEVHPCPEKALSDGAQSLTFNEFKKLMDEIKSIARAINREI
ncbi:3-deoxy-7-phosphoheptulonate synthase [Candidatus Aminicenantes bacterium AC-335-A11]|jgi:3-deoxy-7-phosphoheptulonate synthase|nr:3-deoxy-7-phosphoheptulonate synthase [SCandidatus Aminicenantes bacterium Aminicenantia_JdfR_composite]MCP2597089.1 3-deoxy-7-phosphoheptulonate synthase [Candidatus Aminicenantes bacterium AC-335-G13]MCP2605682.1 3-deoxy-7-phosphoheptulonate synthase [Candidatus Aminicenantes bacterium AC-335-O07]MCP2606341.1 3-deoxy-7-phosphoheptulonate synthase [Candidatus Aminicenantes bacterium AC-708-I09]MCP2618710.1 3-deoxy-7-phosphoheptulonate synthase [Candidatus Aminicenantes bacterium AC-335-A11]